MSETHRPPAAWSADVLSRAALREPVALGKVLTELERGGERALALVPMLWALPPRHTQTVGITGAAGVGKSSLLSRLLTRYSDLGRQPAAIAIDPSSADSGGAFLGDRVRMSNLAPSIFLRSLPNHALGGGLAPAAAISVEFLARCGFDPVIVETVGVGQSEVAVSEIVHTTVTCLAPGLGDEIQAAKAGLMECADVFVITKGDLPAAAATGAQVRAMTNVGFRGRSTRRRPVQVVSARTGDGVDALLDEISKHYLWCEESGRGATTRRALAAQSVLWAAELLARRSRAAAGTNQVLHELADDVRMGRLDPVSASRQLLGRL